MAESAVSFLLKDVTIWLQEEWVLLGGLRDEVQIIHDKLEQMRAFLRVADGREETNPQVKEWVRQVREIANDMEDVLESYMLRCGSETGGNIKKFYASMKNLKAKHKVISQIKTLRSRAENASKTFKDLSFEGLGLSSDTIANDDQFDGRGNALLLEEADIVGIQRPKRQLLDWISTNDYTHKVVSVVGMAGLGKTTLVKKVYDDPLVKENFDHHVWVTVSETYKLKNLLVDLIKQLLHEVKQKMPIGLETMNVDSMRELIYKFLQNKKYIMVFDDIWSTSVWEALRDVFPRSATHGQGCIIITSRLNSIGDVASCENGGHVYHLQPLLPQQAEELFHKKAFLGGSCPDNLKEISKTILRKCGGLPLAIVVIGSALATKRNDIHEWTKFSLSLEFEVEDDTLKRIWKLLSLSYYDLPYYLKACLLYLSIFPEDVLLEKATIIRLWTAQGFVLPKQWKAIDEIAEGYLNELSNRSLIQVVTTTEDGRPNEYSIHDLVRDYIISKAREQNIVAVKSQDEIILEDRIRCLALVNSSICHIKNINKFKYLRGLLFFDSMDLELGSTLNKVLHGSCKMLKVLDLKGAPLDAIPHEVFKLYHLKYLSLRNTNVSLIPKSIKNLLKLETLDLKGSRVIKLPIEILKLRKLRHLLVYTYPLLYGYLQFNYVLSFEAPYEIGQLSCLQKLCYIAASTNIVREIGRLTELRRLRIAKLRKGDGKQLCSSLANLKHLTSLGVSSIEESEVIDLQYSIPPTSLQFLRTLTLQGRLEKLPQWMPSLSVLTYLRLRWSRIKEDPLESLQWLPKLQILEINCAYEGEGLNFKSEGFQKLRKLFLYHLKGLKWVRMEKGSMPDLDTFDMASCKAMMELPVGIEHLTNLGTVDFNDMAKEFEDKLSEEKKREGSQWKLAHVPRIRFLTIEDGEFEERWL